MARVSSVVILFLLGLTLAAAGGFIRPRGETIPGQYVVVLKSTISDEAAEAHIAKMQDGMAIDNSTLLATYKIGSFRGYSARLSTGLLKQELMSSEVDYIEADQVARISTACSTQITNEWGLDRIDQRNLPLVGQFNYDSTSGTGVDAYVVDTGVLITHNDFGGRASWGQNYVGDGQNTDCNGHGTHVAGTIAGTTWGVSKQASIFAVKVLGCGGSGSYTGVISGVNYVADQYNARKKPSVANMSLGGGKFQPLEDAIKAAVAAGVNFVLAAGNENRDACLGSPSGVGGLSGPAITVGATTNTDVRASFSNYGTCTDVFAPGQNIQSAWIGSNSATRIISGTSMAAPHVAGVVGLLLSVDPTLDPAKVKALIASNATPNVLNLACGGSTSCLSSPNLNLYTPC